MSALSFVLSPSSFLAHALITPSRSSAALHPLSQRQYASPTRVRCCVEAPSWKGPIDPDFAKDDQLQVLEESLSAAVEQEDFAHASEVKDKLLRLQSGALVSVLSANMKFYKALNARSIVDIAGCWMQSKSVSCKFPYGELMNGYIDVINAFGYLFTLSFPPVAVQSNRIIMRGSVGYVTCEEISTEDDGSQFKSFSTNIFEKRNGQWYITHRNCIQIFE